MNKMLKTMGNVAIKTGQRSLKAAASTNPASAAMYEIVEKQVRNKLRRQRQKNNRNRIDGGAHVLSAPISQAVAASGVTPTVRTNGETKIISGQELLTPNLIVTNTSWTYDSDGYLINPLESILPLLANEAQNYQLYRFTNLKLQYENTCPSTTAGQLFLGCLSDVADSVPSGPEEATAIKNSVRGPVWSGMEFSFPCDGMFRYVNGTSISDADLRNVYQFRAYFGILNGTMNASIGSLRLTYTIELSKRIVGNDPSQLDLVFTNVAPAGLIAALKAASVVNRGPIWFNFDTPNHIVFQAFGSYNFMFYIAAGGDINVATAAAAIVFKDVSGNTITPTIRYSDSGTAAGGSNASKYFVLMTVRMQRGGYIDLAPVQALTGANLYGSFIVERN